MVDMKVPLVCIKFVRNVATYLPNYTAPDPRIIEAEWSSRSWYFSTETHDVAYRKASSSTLKTDGGGRFFRNASIYLPNKMASHPERP
jgi:hypothetical protein